MAPRRTRAHGNAGLGSTYQLGDGRWRAALVVGWTGDGKPIRRTRMAATARDARTKLDELRKEADLGVTTTKTPTTGEWLVHWLDTIAAPKVRPSTLEGYTTTVHVWAIPSFGRVPLDKLQPEHLERLYAHMLDEGRAPATAALTHRTLSRALQVAAERGRVKRNVAKLVQPPSGDGREIAPLTRDEARAVLDTAKGLHNATRWTVALAVGLRQGEALGLSWDDIDFTAGTLTVRHQLQRIPKGEGLHLVPPKSKAGRRTLSIPPELIDALRQHLAEQRLIRVQEGPQWEGWTTRTPWPRGPERKVPLVFAQRNGRPVDPRADHRAWQALLTAADVGVTRTIAEDGKVTVVVERRLHDARHTTATLLLEQGIPARVVMELLGQSQISLTLGTYSHITKRLTDEAAAAMSDALWGGGGTRTAAARRRSV